MAISGLPQLNIPGMGGSPSAISGGFNMAGAGGDPFASLLGGNGGGVSGFGLPGLAAPSGNNGAGAIGGIPGISSEITGLVSMLGTMMAGLMTMITALLAGIMNGSISGTAPAGSGGGTGGANGAGQASQGGTSSVPPSTGGPGIEGAIAEAESLEGKSETGNRDELRGILGGIDPASIPWCAYFVSAMLERHGGSPWGKIGSVQGILDWGKQNNQFIAKGSGQPQRGDAVIFKEGGRSHTGIVTKVNPDGSFETIEGNSSDAVNKRSYSANEATLTGFVRPFA